MVLTKTKEAVEFHLRNKVNDAAVTVPTYVNDSHRQAIRVRTVNASEAKITNALEAMQTKIDARIDALENKNSHRIVHGRESAKLLTWSDQRTCDGRKLLKTHSPAKPITHAFLQFRTDKDRKRFFRLTS